MFREIWDLNETRSRAGATLPCCKARTWSRSPCEEIGPTAAQWSNKAIEVGIMIMVMAMALLYIQYLHGREFLGSS